MLSVLIRREKDIISMKRSIRGRAGFSGPFTPHVSAQNKKSSLIPRSSQSSQEKGGGLRILETSSISSFPKSSILHNCFYLGVGKRGVPDHSEPERGRKST